jgi:hypothetical protein
MAPEPLGAPREGRSGAAVVVGPKAEAPEGKAEVTGAARRVPATRPEEDSRA